MDGESYEDPAVAELLNRDFVCIKVDRDERTRRGRALSAGRAGAQRAGRWPLTAFLTPDGEVFFGGTYFPAGQQRLRAAGISPRADEIARAFREDQERVTTNAHAIREHVVQTLNEAKSGVVRRRSGQQRRRPDGQAVRRALRRLRLGTQVPTLGGDRVPARALARQPGWSRVATGRSSRRRSPQWRTVASAITWAAASTATRSMKRWIVPHFEKMSYDNSELLRAYLSAYQALGTPLFKEVATGIVDWVLEVMADKEPGGGAFATSQDADLTFGDDGDYWT